jgi:hypothetical protein
MVVGRGLRTGGLSGVQQLVPPFIPSCREGKARQHQQERNGGGEVKGGGEAYSPAAGRDGGEQMPVVVVSIGCPVAAVAHLHLAVFFPG